VRKRERALVILKEVTRQLKSTEKQRGYAGNSLQSQPQLLGRGGGGVEAEVTTTSIVLYLNIFYFYFYFFLIFIYFILISLFCNQILSDFLFSFLLSHICFSFFSFLFLKFFGSTGFELIILPLLSRSFTTLIMPPLFFALLIF
jgi:hypothetical protein